MIGLGTLRAETQAFERKPSIEARLGAAILARIWARRHHSLVSERRSRPSASRGSVKIREATFSDFAAVKELKKRWALLPDSLENWKHLWQVNPALKQVEPGHPIGWVLETDGGIVGYLGNIPLIYRYGGAVLRSVAGHAFVVDSAFRASSLSLATAFYGQKSVDLYLTTTAIEAVGRIALGFKCNPLPQKDYARVLFWILRPYPFARIIMEKLGARPTLGMLGGPLASIAIGTDKILRRRWPRRRELLLDVHETSVDEIGDDFEKLWTQKLGEGTRLLADRSPIFLRWHFQIPGHQGTTRVLRCCHKGKFLGYAVVRTDLNPSSGLRRSLVADMLARHDDPEVFRALWIAAYEHAKREGSHVFQVIGFPPPVQELCSQGSPYVMNYPACPFYYKAADPSMHKTLSESAVWYASPFDGDTTLMP